MDDAPQPTRPDSALLERSFVSFYSDPLLSVANLREAALKGLIPQRGLRSLHWRYFFGLLPSPTGPSASTSAATVKLLDKSRAEYSALREKYLRSPDGGWVNDGAQDRADPSVGRGAPPPGPREQLDVNVNNPLGLDEGNKWSAWFKDLELRRVIRQDVQRTFPELDYFREPEVQDQMTDLLFILVKDLIPDIGYRQGMHELLAPLLWTVDWDSLDPLGPSESRPVEQLAHTILSRQHVEHDAWALFAALMNSAKRLYDHTPSVPLPVDKPSNASTTSLTLSNTAGYGAGGGSGTGAGASTVQVQPIVGTAIRIHDRLLKTVDRELWAKLEELQIEPQLWALRWLRMLFGREFPMDDHLVLLDGLFAEDPTLRLCEYVAVAMLLRLRDALVAADYSGALQLLLRYPALPDGSFRPEVLLEQAIFLRDNSSAEAGARCRAQNAERGTAAGRLGGGEDEPETTPRKRSEVRARSQVGPGLAISGLLGDVSELAKNEYVQAGAKGLFGVFREFSKNLNGAGQSRDGGMSQIPSHAPWEHRAPAAPAKDYLSEIGKMRKTSLEMARALDLCITVFEKELVLNQARTGEAGAGPKPAGAPLSPPTSTEEDGPASEVGEGEDAVHLEKTGSPKVKDENGSTTASPALPRPEPSSEVLFAMTALKHVRDTLGGQSHAFDPNVLSPLVHALEDGRFPDPPPRSPGLTPPAPPPPAQASAAPMGRTRSTSPVNRQVRSPTTGAPSLMLGARTDKPLPSLTRTPQGAAAQRPVIPPWESSRANFAAHSTALGDKAQAELPGLPKVPEPSASAPVVPTHATIRTSPKVGGGGGSAAGSPVQEQATFSPKAAQGGGGKVADPLGVDA